MAAIMRGNDRVATILPPGATDAQEQSVPASYEIEGRDRLVIRVPHRDADLAYPILVDPVFEYYSGTNFPGWYFTSNEPAGWFFSGTGNDGAGLYVGAYHGGCCYDPGAYGEWVHQSRPGAYDAAHGQYTGTYIYRFDLQSVRHVADATTYVSGIYSPMRNGWEPGAWTDTSVSPNEQTWSGASFYDTRALTGNYKTFCARPVCPWQPPGDDIQPGNQAIFGLQVDGLDRTNRIPAYVYLPSAYTFSYDHNAPYFTRAADGIPTTDWTENYSAHVVLHAQDDGYGMSSVSLGTPGSFQTVPPANACQNTQCPATMDAAFDYSTSSAPEGISWTSTYANDALGNSLLPGQYNRWPIKIDRSPPDLSFSGALAVASNRDFVYSDEALHVDAVDGHPSWGDSGQRSGVSSIDIYVDGQRQGSSPAQTCSGDSCPLSRDWTYQPSQYGPGDHTVRIVATDRMGHSSEQSWTVHNDDNTPTTQFANELGDADGTVIANRSYDLTIDASDGTQPDAPESGVKSIAYAIDGGAPVTATQGCATDSCDMSQNLTFNGAQAGAGDHAITVTTTDQVGNQSTDTLEFTVVDVPDLPSDLKDLGSSSLAATGNRTSMAGANLGQSVSPIGDIDNDGHQDYAVAAPQASNGIEALSGVVYVVYGGGDPHPNLNALGSQGFRLTGGVFDHAGASVTPVGYINHDRYPDFAIGATRTDPLTGQVTGLGIVYVVFGGPRRGDLSLTQLQPNNAGFYITGPDPSPGYNTLTFGRSPRTFGVSVSGRQAGFLMSSSDFNGDGRDDLIIGDSSQSRNTTDLESGAAYVIFGKDDTSNIDATSLGSRGIKITGLGFGAQAGYSVGAVGDVNGDGYDDMAVGSPGVTKAGSSGTGWIDVVYGTPTPHDVDLGTISQSEGFQIAGGSAEQLGTSIVGLGDLNGDQLADYAVAGKDSIVLYGSDNNGSDIDTGAAGFGGYRINAPAAANGGDTTLASGGDINRDGVPDLAIAYPQASSDGRSGNGLVYAVYSRPRYYGDDTTSTLSLDSLPGQLGTRFAGASSGDNAGRGVGLMSDDGTVLIGAPGNSTTTAPQGGAAYNVPEGERTGHDAKVPSCRNPYPANTTPPAFTGHKDVQICRAISPDYPSVVDYSGAPNHPRRGKAFTATPLKPNRMIELKDAFGRRFMWVQQVGRRVTFYKPGADPQNPDADEIGHTLRNLTVNLDGPQCMADASLDYSSGADTRLVGLTFQSGDHPPGLTGVQDLNNIGKTHDGHSIELGIRGYIDPRQVRPTTADQMPINSYFKRHTTRCIPLGALEGLFNDKINEDNPQVVRQPFARYPSDLYQGATVANCRDANDPGCGGAYANYERPLFTGEDRQDVVTLTGATTGVRGGGIPRTVINGTTGAHMRTLLTFNYNDTNVPCRNDYIARWSLVDANVNGDSGHHLFGYYVAKQPSAGTHNC